MNYDTSMQDTYIAIKKTKKKLARMIKKLPELTRQLAKAEREYRMAYTKECVKMHIDGISVDDYQADEVAWTVAPRLVKGVPAVAQKKYHRDVLEGDKKAVMQRIYKLKLDLNMLEKEMEAISKGE